MTDLGVDTAAAPAPRYALVCQGCGWRTEADHHTVHCPDCGPSAFLRTEYRERDLTLSPGASEADFTGYRAWLPVELRLPLSGLNIGLVHAEALGAELGLNQLWLLVSGYVPDLGATLPTATFKTLEAAGVMMRVVEQTDRTLIVSSAGNAGCAVLEMGAQLEVSGIVIVPENAREAMCTATRPGPRAPLLVCLEQATYSDAIRLVGQVVERFPDTLVREGGAFNVARRDAMAVPVLRAVRALHRIPDHYVQAVGSGTGGVAAHEACLRLLSSGTVSGAGMRLHLVQNEPFIPMVEAWRAGTPDLVPLSSEEAWERLQQTYSTVLANAAPPFGVAGGVYDVLVASDGEMLSATNDEARSACRALNRAHHLEASPEAGVAFAGLRQLAVRRSIHADDTVLVHVTGAGWSRSVQEMDKIPYPVGLSAHHTDVDAVSSVVARYLDRIA